MARAGAKCLCVAVAEVTLDVRISVAMFSETAVLSQGTGTSKCEKLKEENPGVGVESVA
jgi:hypothetical protein